MQLEFYNALKTKIQTLTALKFVGLWDNQFERENENVPFGYPCCFIEFTDITYYDYLKGVQKYDMTVNLHLGFESYKNEDTDILQLKQSLHNIVHTFQADFNTKMLRRSEIQNFDHTNIQEYILSYETSGKDYFVTTEVETTINTLILNADYEAVRLTEDGSFRITENNELRLLE